MIDWSLYKGNKLERSKKAFEEFVELLDKEGYKLIGEYINTKTKIKIQCDKGHKYEVIPSMFKIGRRCPHCYRNHLETSKLDFINQVENEGYKLLGKYKSMLTKVKLQCDKGHIYETRPDIYKRGSRCPICCGLHPETVGINFEEMVENEGYKLLGKYKSTLTKVKLQCDKGHEYFVTPHNFKRGSRCPVCCGLHPETAKEDFIIQVEKEGYKILGGYINTKTKVELQCNEGHKYEARPSDFKTGNRCPHCNTASHGERLTRKILEECKLGFEQQKKFDGLTGLGGRALSYDFFVEGYLLIEIQGEQHYKPIDLFGREERFKQQQEHDKRKREFAINNGYKLLEIPYFSPRDLDKLENTLREELNNLLVLEEVS